MMNRMRYSNSGYDILGMIIEKITGKTYELAINGNIFKPFKMIHSGYDYTKLQSRYKTVGYSYISATRHTTAPVWDTSWEYASGGLYSSLSDLAKFDQALQTNQLIRKELLAKTYTPTQWNYGYGWFIHTLFGKKVAYHSGNLEGATSYFGRIPEDDICIIILLNETNTIIESLANKVIAILYDQPYVLPKPKQAIALSDEQLKKYIGTYDISDAYQTSVALKDHFLYLSTNNTAPVQILPETENRFFISDSNMTITFNPNQTGKLALKIQDGLSTKVGELN
jgi:CubicO group peptidase (beta-lactamase class C family)